MKLNLTKEESKPVVLTLNKCSKFTAKLFWQSKHDIDVHAVSLNNAASIDDDAGRILSTYNPACVLQSDGKTNITAGTKKPFQNHKGYLKHEGDRRDGLKGDDNQPDEVIVFDIESIPQGEEVGSVIFAVSIHPPSTATFSEIRDCRIVIEDDNGKQLIDGMLTSDFDQYGVVVVGRIENNNGVWEFNPRAIGYDKNSDGSPADFNTVLTDFNR